MPLGPRLLSPRRAQNTAQNTARISVGLIAVCLLAACSGGTDHRAAGGEERSAAPTSSWALECTGEEPLVEGVNELTSDGDLRRYLVALPPDFDPTRPTPVIVNLHGYSSSMEEQATYSRLPAEGTERGDVVVTPDGSGTPRGWELDRGPDDDFIVNLLEVIDARMCVDPARVFVAGMSNGSALAGFLVCRHPERFAAAAMVAAAVPPVCPPDVLRSALMIHGTADPIVPYDGGTVHSAAARGRTAPGVEATAQTWAEQDRCAGQAEVERVADDVILRTWPDCRGHTAVQLYTIEEGGHTWPGPIDLRRLGIDNLGSTTESIDATKLILDFFDQHPLP